MKNQDTIRIMDRIEDAYVEEAVTWDGAARKSRRSIRRLSLGIGAIAASIAVVIGCIGYDAHRDNLYAGSGADTAEQQLNLFGGHGEIKGYLCTGDNVLYRDDDNYYLTGGFYSDDAETSDGGPSPDSFYYFRWPVSGGSDLERLKYDGRLLTDGERLYNYHDNQLYVTDSYGNETSFYGVPWKPCKIRKLSDDWYYLSAYVEDSWLNGKPQPYVLINTKGDQINQFVDYGNVQSDGENLYYSDFEGNIYAAPLTNVLDSHAVVRFEDGELTEWTLVDNKIYSLNGPTVMYCSELPESENQLADQTMYDIPDEMDCRKYHLLNDDMYVFGVQFGEGSRTLLADSSFTNNESKEYFNIETASLWNRAFSDGDIDNFFVFDTGENIIFSLPVGGKNGELLVQVNKETGDYQYISYPIEPPAAETDAEDHTEAETETNVLGGKGKIRVYDNKFNTVAEDDEYLYAFDYDPDLNTDFLLRARKLDEDAVFERYAVPNLPQYDPAADPNDALYLLDGIILLTDNGKLYEVGADGSLTQLLALYGDDESNVRYGRIQGFAKDASGRPTKLFMRFDNYDAVLNLETGIFQTLKPNGYAAEYAVSENAVYAAGYHIGSPNAEPIDFESADTETLSSQYELITFDDDGQPVLCSTPEWGFSGLEFALFDADENIWFKNNDGQICKGNPKDRSVTAGSEEEWRKMNCIPDTNKYLTIEDNRIVLRNADGSDPVTLKEGDASDNKELFIEGAYTENGVIHFYAEEVNRNDYGADETVQLIFFTVDGKSVSSFGVKFHE